MTTAPRGTTEPHRRLLGIPQVGGRARNDLEQVRSKSNDLGIDYINVVYISIYIYVYLSMTIYIYDIVIFIYLYVYISVTHQLI